MKILSEITPLGKEDFFYLVDRNKDEFTYPLHRHDEIEINYIENCAGARRIVGDSVETCGQYDLVMIGGALPHTWSQAACATKPIREITIQFAPDVFGKSILDKRQFASIKRLFENCQSGICFGIGAMMDIHEKIIGLKDIIPEFRRVLAFWEILYRLSVTEDYRLLSSSNKVITPGMAESRRVQKVEAYINEHYSEEIRLQDLAEIVCMSPSAFSRFFKLRTGRTVMDFIIDIRIKHASRMLSDTSMSVIEICYACGFNNVSNFNRIFKRRKGEAPSSFRENYRKTKVII